MVFVGGQIMANSAVTIAVKKPKKETIQGVLGLVMTLLKPVWAFIIVWSLVYPRLVSGIVIVILMIWDNLNGVLFRRSWLAGYYWLSRLRRIIDAGGDRFTIHFVCVMMIFRAGFPVAYYGQILVRELTLVLVVTLTSFGSGRIINPNWWSKSGTICIGCTGISWLLLDDSFCLLFLVGMWFFTALGTWAYCRSAIESKAIEPK